MPQPCSVCEKVDDFSNEGGKCVLHCDKEDWFEDRDGEERDWSRAETAGWIVAFWRAIRTLKAQSAGNLILNKIAFPKWEDFPENRLPVGTVDGTPKKNPLIKNENFWGTNEHYSFDRLIIEFCRFHEEVDFSHIKFGGQVVIRNSVFEKPVSFQACKFISSLDIQKVQFETTCLFVNAWFDEVVQIVNLCHFVNLSFWRAKFEKGMDIRSYCSVGRLFVLQDVRTEKPITLFGMQLGSEFKITNTDIQKIKFHNCKFPEKKERILWVLKQKRYIIAEEKNSAEHEDVEKSYIQLKENFEAQKDYKIANHFFAGELETKRKILKNERFYAGKNEKNRFKKIKYHFPSFEEILLDVYKNISFYGLNILAPLVWIVLGVIVLAFIFSFKYSAENIEILNFHHNFVRSLEVFSFQKDVFEFPTYLQRFLMIFAKIISLTFSTIFILGIRRHFKR